MLSLIIEKLDGRSYAESVDARIIRRLGLNQTRVLTSASTFDDIAPAHPETPAETEAGFSFATPFGAGCIAATAGCEASGKARAKKRSCSCRQK